MYHYVYIVTDKNTGEFYIGSRSCKCLPEDDVKYKGSQYQWKLSAEQKKSLDKKIIETNFIDRRSAIEFEAFLIKNSFNDPLNRNGTIPDGKYHTNGKAIVKDSEGKIYCVEVADPRYLSGELVSANKGKKFTDEHKAKISWSGKKHTEETKEKMRISQRHRKRNHKTRAKAILQFNLDWEFIKEWESLSSAAKNYNTSPGSLFTGVDKENSIRVGYRWKWKN